VGGYINSNLSVIIFDNGFGQGIRCRLVCDWFKRDSYVSTKEKLLLEIGKIHPDVVVLDLGLYEKIDGIEISRVIRSRFDVPMMYV